MWVSCVLFGGAYAPPRLSRRVTNVLNVGCKNRVQRQVFLKIYHNTTTYAPYINEIRNYNHILELEISHPPREAGRGICSSKQYTREPQRKTKTKNITNGTLTPPPPCISNADVNCTWLSLASFLHPQDPPSGLPK